MIMPAQWACTWAGLCMVLEQSSVGPGLLLERLEKPITLIM